MVVKTIKTHWEISSDYLKLFYRNLRGQLKCPMCEKHISKIKTFTICRTCDESFSNHTKAKKRKIIKKIKRDSDHSVCSLCNEKELKLDNRLYFCPGCDLTFHP